jgi:DNA-binding transcriptional ArsR family regulator
MPPPRHSDPGTRGEADVAAAASLLAEPARVALLTAVIDDGPLPATELAARAGIAVSTASEHLSKLVAGSFLVQEKRGRSRIYALGAPEVAAAVEALMVVAPRRQVTSLRAASRAEVLRRARTCYDHLAGRLGIGLARALERRGVLARVDDGLELGSDLQLVEAVGIDLERLARGRRPVVRGCLDWSEREPHVAGALGAALARRFVEVGWIRRREANRSVVVTEAGREALISVVGIEETHLPS